MGAARLHLSGHRFRRRHSDLHTISASRPFLEDRVGARVRRLPNVRFVDACDVVGPLTDDLGQSVVGPRILRRANGSAEETVAADLVVDALGRGSRTPVWLWGTLQGPTVTWPRGGIRDAQPLDDPIGFRFPASVRRRYERTSALPDGLVPVGDSVCGFNPIYGQGMIVTGLGALALRKHLRRRPIPDPRQFIDELADVLDARHETSGGSSPRYSSRPSLPSPRSPSYGRCSDDDVQTPLRSPLRLRPATRPADRRVVTVTR